MTGLLAWWDWALVGLVVALLLGWYLSWTAARLDRLHHRVESSRAALDVQLARRAATALETVHVLDPATGLLLADAAAGALTAADEPAPSLAVLEEAENDLTRALHAAFASPQDVLALRSDPAAAEQLDLLGQACLRVQLARRFHNDAVAQAQRVRRKPVVRWARLAGHAGWPQMVELDDSPPAGLLGLPG